MQSTDSIAQLVAVAATAKYIPGPHSLAERIAPSSRIWTAQIITRWADGCQIRVADEHDAVLPADAVPVGADYVRIRIRQEGLVILPAA